MYPAATLHGKGNTLEVESAERIRFKDFTSRTELKVDHLLHEKETASKRRSEKER